MEFKMRKILSISFIMFVIIIEQSVAAASYSYRTPMADSYPFSSEDEELFITLSVIVGGIYAWWYFNREKK